MTTFRDLCSFSAIAALLASSAAFAANFSFRLDPAKIEPGQRSRLEIRLPLSEIESHSWTFENDPPRINDEFLTRSKVLQILETSQQKTETEIIWTYHLTTHKTGNIAIPPIEIKVGAHTFSTESLNLNSFSTRPPGDFALREGYGKLSIPIKWDRILNALAVILFALILYWAWKRWGHRLQLPLPKSGEAPITLLPRESPRQWLNRHLNRLSKKLSLGEEATLVAEELTEILREYYSRISAHPVQSWTTGEFSDHFHDDGRAQAIVEIMYHCDYLKFSPRQTNPTEQLNHSLSQCRSILL